MKFVIHGIIQILFCFLFFASLQAQGNDPITPSANVQAKENNKGTSLASAWSRKTSDIDYYSTVQNHQISRLQFGNWKFKAIYSSPHKIIEKSGVRNYRSYSPVALFGLGNTALLKYDTILVEGKTPAKTPFIVHFKYMADIFEKDVSKGLTMLLKEDHTYEFGYYYYKMMEGFASVPSG